MAVLPSGVVAYWGYLCRRAAATFVGVASREAVQSALAPSGALTSRRRTDRPAGRRGRLLRCCRTRLSLAPLLGLPSMGIQMASSTWQKTTATTCGASPSVVARCATGQRSAQDGNNGTSAAPLQQTKKPAVGATLVVARHMAPHVPNRYRTLSSNPSSSGAPKLSSNKRVNRCRPTPSGRLPVRLYTMKRSDSGAICQR